MKIAIQGDTHFSSPRAYSKITSSSVCHAASYKFGSSGNAATEIGEKLMRPGANQDLGLSLEQARTLGDLYVQTLRKEYGSAATDEIARRVSGALR